MLNGVRKGGADVLGGRVDHGRLARLITVWTCIGLTIAFTKNAAKFNLDWLDYIGYAVGMAMASSPSLVREFIHLKFGVAAPAAHVGSEK